MRFSLALVLLLSSIFALACGDDGSTPGSDSGMDSTIGMDSGTSDAGEDSGTGNDAGSDAATDTTTGTDGGGDTGADAGPQLSTGMTCETNAECESGTCWDFSERDSACDGKVCSIGCTSDPQCQEAAEAAGAETPASATCGDDEECSFVGTGLGVFACG